LGSLSGPPFGDPKIHESVGLPADHFSMIGTRSSTSGTVRDRLFFRASVTHFEIYADDAPHLAEFYEKLFGWRINKAPGIDYFQIQTGPADQGGIRGGLLHRPIPGPRSWVHYVSVYSVDEAVQQVCRAWAGSWSGPRRRSRRWPGMPWWRIPMATSSPCGRPIHVPFLPTSRSSDEWQPGDTNH
jgi:predicted enzyme related to lactoylglutathione lyase